MFAIVLTLIVIEIRIPEGTDAELPAQLVALVPTFLTYALTFVTLGALWFGNRTQGEFIRRADHPLVWLTLLMLGLVALVPFSSGLVAAHPGSSLAVVVLGVHLTAVYLVHGSVWLYASLHPALLRDGVTDAYRRRSRLFAYLPAAGYAVATGLGAIWPIVGLVAFLVVPLPLVLGLYYRGLAQLHDAAQRS